MSAPAARSLAVLAALAAIAPLSIASYLPALPDIQRALATTPTRVELTMAAYLAGLAIGQLVLGPISDRIGRRPVLRAGLVLYICASLSCALAPDAAALIVGRFAQALGAASAMVLSRAIVRDFFCGAAASRVISGLVMVMGVTTVIAPLIGGLALEIAGWRGVFVMLAAVGVGELALVMAVLPETAAPRREIGSNVRALVTDRSFVAAALAGALSHAGLQAYIVGSPFALMGWYGMSPSSYAAIYALNASGFVIGSLANRRWLTHSKRRRGDPRTLLAGGCAALVVAAVTLAAAVAVGAPVAVAVAAMFGFVFSLALVVPNAVALAMEAHANRAGAASALLGASQFAVATIAASIVGSLHDGTPGPMVLVMVIAALAAAVAGVARSRR